jgi:hypothetical protein
MFGTKLARRQGEGASRGTDLFFDSRLCFQARDYYYNCLSNQNRKGQINIYLEPNKYLCMDDLINYETYCPPDFIYNTKQKYYLRLKNAKVWTQQDLDLINFRRNHMTLSKIFI